MHVNITFILLLKDITSDPNKRYWQWFWCWLFYSLWASAKSWKVKSVNQWSNRTTLISFSVIFQSFIHLGISPQTALLLCLTIAPLQLCLSQGQWPSLFIFNLHLCFPRFAFIQHVLPFLYSQEHLSNGLHCCG